jgi:hypothetical protein
MDDVIRDLEGSKLHTPWGTEEVLLLNVKLTGYLTSTSPEGCSLLAKKITIFVGEGTTAVARVPLSIASQTR